MIDPVEFGKQLAAIVRDATEPLKQKIKELEAALENQPKPKDGESVTVEDVAPMVREEVAKAVSQIPAPKDGDSVSVDEVAAVFERRFSDLTLSWERQARDTFERAADKMPIPKDGRDALPLETFDLSLSEDGRTVTIKMQAGETTIEKSIRIPSVIDRGPYKQGNTYEKGDGVTHGGSFWIAQGDKPEGAPGMGGKGWRLAVKKGRDGRDLRDNASSIDPNKGVSIK